MARPEQRTDFMKKITKEFADEPLCTPFLKPVGEENSKIKGDYNSRIKHPMDLQTVKKKIKDNEYKGYQEWIDDMNLIWDNAVEFNTAEHVIGGIAIYMKKKFKKRILALDATNLRNYEAQLQKLTKNIQDILSQPAVCFNVQPIKDNSADLSNFTISRVQNIMEGVEKLEKEGKTDMVMQVIKEKEPDFHGGADYDIDFGLLGRATLISLEELIKNNSN